MSARTLEKGHCCHCGKKVRACSLAKPYFCRQTCAFFFGRVLAERGYRMTKMNGETIVIQIPEGLRR